MQHFAKKSREEESRNSAEDSVGVLSTGGDAAESSSSYPSTGLTSLGGWRWGRSLPA